MMNANLEGQDLYQRGAITPGALHLLAQAADRFGLSARAHERALRVARTIADLDDADAVSDDHLADALHFR